MADREQSDQDDGDRCAFHRAMKCTRPEKQQPGDRRAEGYHRSRASNPTSRFQSVSPVETEKLWMTSLTAMCTPK